MKIVWDEPKRRTNLAIRDLNFADLEIAFFKAATIVPVKHGRSMAIGWFGGSVLAIIFRPLGTEGLSIISMRRASRKERRLHGDET